MSEIGQGFNRIDASGDDQLTWEEFENAAASYYALKQLKVALESEEGKAELKALWDRLDEDKNGQVSGKEWGSKVYSEQAIMSK